MEEVLKLWILDADVIIDLLNVEVFDNLIEVCSLHLATTVIDEVKHFYKDNVKTEINLREQYVSKGVIIERDASQEDLAEVVKSIPSNIKIHDGELTSLAVLIADDKLKFCCADSAAIRALPFLDLSDRGISLENLLKQSGLTVNDLKERHTEEYFQNNLKTGQEQKIYSF